MYLLSPECFLLDTDLAVTSSLSKRGRLLTSSWGAMGTTLLRRALLSGPPSSAWDHEMSKIVHSLTKTQMKWCKRYFKLRFGLCLTSKWMLGLPKL
jgi:hypothetical protein